MEPIKQVVVKNSKLDAILQKIAADNNITNVDNIKISQSSNGLVLKFSGGGAGVAFDLSDFNISSYNNIIYSCAIDDLNKETSIEGTLVLSSYADSAEVYTSLKCSIVDIEDRDKFEAYCTDNGLSGTDEVEILLDHDSYNSYMYGAGYVRAEAPDDANLRGCLHVAIYDNVRGVDWEDFVCTIHIEFNDDVRDAYNSLDNYDEDFDSEDDIF
jgi:hypothetical protein